MDFYLNLLNEKERAPDDAPSIGIILCAEKDDIDVEFALKPKTNPDRRRRIPNCSPTAPGGARRAELPSAGSCRRRPRQPATARK